MTGRAGSPGLDPSVMPRSDPTSQKALENWEYLNCVLLLVCRVYGVYYGGTPGIPECELKDQFWYPGISEYITLITTHPWS